MSDIEMTEYERLESSYVRQHLSELIDSVLTGRSYTVTRHGRDVAQLVPVSAPSHSPTPHSGQGKLMEKIKRHDEKEADNEDPRGGWSF